jgi:hypothetical protein
MGLLDEAIKEHLELKRRHGADPAEVAQQEREAFGPARRGPEPLEVPPPADEAEPVDPVLIEPEVDAPAYEPPADAEPRPQPERSEALPEPDPVAEDLAFEDTATHAVPPPPPAPAPAPEGEGESEDVLEETPEFLQETPEHDRLWFEQRPPRDFDFDG